MKTSTLLLLLLLSHAAGAQIIYTICGNGEPDYSGDYGPAINAKVNYPFGIVVDRYDNIYFADGINSAVRMIDTLGIITTVAGNGFQGYSGDGGPALMARMSIPLSIAIDKSHNIYVAEEGNSVIRKIDTHGIITTIAGTGVAGYSGDNGPAVNAQLYAPSAIAFHKNGNLLVACSVETSAIRIIDTTGIIHTIAGTGVAGYAGDNGPATNAQISEVLGLATDTAGNIYFSDFGNQRIRKINSAGIISTYAGTGVLGFSGDGGPATLAQLHTPGNLTLDSADNLYVVDIDNARIRRISTSGIITTIAGNGSTVWSGDGGSPLAAGMQVRCSAFDKKGNIYLTDCMNNRIRKIMYNVGQTNYSNNNSVSITPNPAHGNITLKISGAVSEQLRIVITDIMGRPITETSGQTNSDITLHLDAPPGLYQLTVAGTTVYQTEKMVIEQ